ncbi:MAG: hypothetical protein JRC57_05775 [Deltaproteobacteria bacterium]|jgi:hypothetical protein|nr:hypothetical protein [Deltaproteobacteria bacterium]
MIKKIRAYKVFLIVCIGFITVGCVRAKSPELPYSNQQKSNLTAGMVKKYVKVGETTQTDILTVFGAPNIITRDKESNEVWTYDRQSIASASEVAEWNTSGSVGVLAGGLVGNTAVGGGASIGGSSGKGSTAGQVSSATFTLIIKYDENDVVQDYRMMATQF